MFLFFVINGGRDALLNTSMYTIMYVDEYLGWTVTSAKPLVTYYHVTYVVVHAMSPTRMMLFGVVTLLVSSCLMLAG